MNIIKSLQDLINVLHIRDEVIVFPIGNEGQALLDFFKYTNFLRRVCCIASPQDNGEFPQRFVNELPIIPIEYLVHFRETAVLIVATPEQFYPQLDTELTRFGFKLVVFIHGDTYKNINDELQKLYSSGQALMWYMSHLDKKIAELGQSIEEQNEIATVNTKAFKKYRNAFRDKEVVLVGSGATLNYYTPIKDAIHIALNYAWKRNDISFDYLFSHDAGGRNRTIPWEDSIQFGFSKIKDRVFVGKFFERDFGYSEHVSLIRNNIFRYFVGSNAMGQPIYQDICKHKLTDFYSIYSAALQFAFFTYPKKIYLVGCDCAHTGHFYDKNAPFTLYGMKVGYARMKMFAKRYYPDTEIISINPVGLRGLFRDVYTDEYQASLMKNGILANDKK